MNLNNKNYCHIVASPSKSDFIRKVAAACLFGSSRLNYSGKLSEDSLAALGMARALGCRIETENSFVEISSPALSEKKNGLVLNAGESALALNLFSVVASFYACKYSIALKGTLARRKFDVGDVLRHFGVRYARHDDRIDFEGAIQARDYTFDTDESNQMISALLFGAAACGGEYEFRHPSLASVGYLKMTCDALRSYGVEVDCNGKKTRIDGRPSPTDLTMEFTVEGDWSSAANFLAAGAFYRPIVVSGLNLESNQPDKKIIEILSSAGSMPYCEGDKVIIYPSYDLSGFVADLSGAPDLFPPVAVLALYCEGKTKLRGVRRLRNKESDRAAALVDELSKIGGKLEISGDELIITGKSNLNGARINARGDHRIAMAALIATLGASVQADIDQPDCINKSYPAFLHDFSTLLSYD